MIEQRRLQGGDPVDLALSDLVGSLVSPHVVDVGGGSGTRAVPLAIEGCRVTVVDSSADALAILHRRAQDAGVDDRVVGVQADAESLGTVVQAGAADLVLCHHLLEEVDEPAAVVAGLAMAVRPGGHVSVLSAGRLGAVLGQTLAGRFAQASAMLTDPDGRYSGSDPMRRRFDASGIGGLLTTVGLSVQYVTGVGVLSGLVSGAARQAVPGGDGALAQLEAGAAAHPVLREIAADLHVVARRPEPDLPGPDDPGRSKKTSGAGMGAATDSGGAGSGGATALGGPASGGSAGPSWLTAADRHERPGGG